MEALLTIIGLLILSAISSWLQRRSQQAGEEPWPEGGRPPAQPPAERRAPKPGEEGQRPRPSRLEDWEAELRRLLEGGGEEEHRKPAPPVITKPAAPTPPAPQRPARPLPIPVPTEKPLTVPPVIESGEGGPSESSGRFHGALSGYRDAQNLQGAIENRMLAAAASRRQRSLPGQTTRLARKMPPVGAMLRSPSDVRLAMVASIVLGPPKAME